MHHTQSTKMILAVFKNKKLNRSKKRQHNTHTLHTPPCHSTHLSIVTKQTAFVPTHLHSLAYSYHGSIQTHNKKIVLEICVLDAVGRDCRSDNEMISLFVHFFCTGEGFYGHMACQRLWATGLRVTCDRPQSSGVCVPLKSSEALKTKNKTHVKLLSIDQKRNKKSLSSVVFENKTYFSLVPLNCSIYIYI
jgi:hypothetical protein